MNALILPLLAAFACVAPTPKGSDTTVDSARPGDSGPTDSAPPTDSATTDGPHTYTAVQTAWSTACALRDDAEVVCWGEDVASGEVLSPPPGPFSGASLGEGFACGLRPDGRVTCWGDYDWLGEGPELAGTWVDFDCGEFHACGVDAETGGVRCLGEGRWGQATPPQLEDVSAVRAGWNISCALDRSGVPTCWGYDDAKPWRPQPEGITLTSVEVGLAHVCGVGATDGLAVCWGWDVEMADVGPDLGPVLAVGTGDGSTCVVTAAGEIECWGTLDEGEAWGPGFTSVTNPFTFACALDEAGEISCWGDNTYGQTEAPG